MAIYEGLSGPEDYVNEILNVAMRAESECASIDGALGLAYELAEIQTIARKLRAKLEEA